MNKKRLIATILISTLISACTVMSEEECRYADWRVVGYEDGNAGQGIDRFTNYRTTCADFGVVPDFDAWQAGREQGLQQYCQPRQGFTLGESGRDYNGVCAGELEPDFLEAYRMGSELRALQRAVGSIESAISSREQQINEIDAEIDEFEAIIIVADTTAEERAELLAEMRELTEFRSELIVDHEYLLEQLASAEFELAEYQAYVTDAGF